MYVSLNLELFIFSCSGWHPFPMPLKEHADSEELRNLRHISIPPRMLPPEQEAPFF